MSTYVQRPPSRRVLRTALEVLVALAGLVPAVLAVLAHYGVTVDDRAVVAITGVAVLVATTVVNTVEKAGPVPIWRTVAQVAVAVAAVVPAAVATLAAAGVTVDEAGLTLITGLAVLATTTVQNLLEHRGTIPAIGYPSEARQLVQTDNRPSYIDGPQPGDAWPDDDPADVARLTEAAEVAEAMFTDIEEGRS